jgi:hypothetical protein
MSHTTNEIKVVANRVLHNGCQLTLPNGFDCRVSKLSATKLLKLVKKEIRNQHRKKFHTRWPDTAKSEIDLMCNHYFPRCVVVVFTKREAAGPKTNPLRFGLILDLREDLITRSEPKRLLTQAKIYTLVMAIKSGKPLNADFQALYGFIGRQVYESAYSLKCIVEAASQHTTPQIAALLTYPKDAP